MGKIEATADSGNRACELAHGRPIGQGSLPQQAAEDNMTGSVEKKLAAWGSPADTGKPDRQLCPVRPQRKYARSLGSALLWHRRHSGRKRAAGRSRLDRGGTKGRARLCGQPAGAAQERARRPRQSFARHTFRWFHQFGTRLYRRPQGDERRIRPHGRGIRGQGPTRTKYGRGGSVAGGRCCRSRGHVRDRLIVQWRDWIGSPNVLSPIADYMTHRGGVIENTAAAFSAAIAAGYGIETDLQISADNEAMVHHDDALGRLTEGRGRLAECAQPRSRQHVSNPATVAFLRLANCATWSADVRRCCWSSRADFNGDTRVAKRAVEVLSGYSGPVAVMSFDPVLIEYVRQMGPFLTRGIVAERHYLHAEWDRVPAIAKQSMAWLLHSPRSRPQFIAYSVRDLPALVPLIARTALRLPLLAWTVRNETDRLTAARWADQIIFEGWRPKWTGTWPYRASSGWSIGGAMKTSYF